MDAFIILRLTRSARLNKKFPGHFPRILVNNLCEWFLSFAIKNTIEIFLELNSGENKERKTAILKKPQADQMF